MWRRAEIFNLRFAAARTLALCVPRTKLAAEPKSKATARAELDSAEGAGHAGRNAGKARQMPLIMIYIFSMPSFAQRQPSSARLRHTHTLARTLTHTHRDTA